MTSSQPWNSSKIINKENSLIRIESVDISPYQWVNKLINLNIPSAKDKNKIVNKSDTNCIYSKILGNSFMLLLF